jgi:crossover junction endodeoxyribonuclease RuvC
VTRFVGIDPGVTGAVAWLEAGSCHVWDIPTIFKGSGFVKQEIDAAALFHHLYQWREGAVGALERVNAMPAQGAASTFSLGDSFGVCRACMASAGISTQYVLPSVWKKYFGLTSNKEESRALAVKMYPKAELHLKKYVDRAEALLIATYLMETHHG